MARIIAVTNQKGGVGKTTTSVNLAASLAAIKRRVLIVDLDPQGNATMGSGVNKYEAEATTADVLLERVDAAAAILPLEKAGYSIIPGNETLTLAEVELMNAVAREFRLREGLEKVRTRFDYILIDSPPSLNTLTVNALVAAHGVIVPTQCEYYALEGLSALMNTIQRIQQTANPKLQIEGLLRTMFDPRNNLANDVSDHLLANYGDQVYQTIIPRNVTLAEAPSHGMPVILYDKTSRGALAYLALAGEVLRRERRISVAAQQH